MIIFRTLCVSVVNVRNPATSEPLISNLYKYKASSKYPMGRKRYKDQILASILEVCAGEAGGTRRRLSMDPALIFTLWRLTWSFSSGTDWRRGPRARLSYTRLRRRERSALHFKELKALSALPEER
jgi:hypothetical protein